MTKLRDYVAAHRKALIALAGLLAIQFLDSDTADWVALVVTVLLDLTVPNDQAAVDRIYPNRKRR